MSYVSTKNEFELTCIAWHEVGPKFGVLLYLEVVLHKHLSLANYTNKVKKLVLIYIAVRPDNILHKEYKGYHWKNQVLEFNLKLDYERLMAADIATTRYMVAALFLKAVQLIPEVRGMKEFDSEGLYRDAKRVFLETGWLPLKEKAAEVVGKQLRVE